MDHSEMLPQPVLRLRRPLTPILEIGENSPEPLEPVCTFDPGYSLSAPDPHVIQEHVTSSHQTDHVTGCPTNQLLDDVQQVVQEIRESPREREDPSELGRLCELYSQTRQAIDGLENELLNIKQQLKQASDEYILQHERATSATSRHRLNKGLREVADEKVQLWRKHCKNFELGYSQKRPEVEQLKIVHSIVKATINNLVEENKYLVTFVEILKKKRAKLYEQKYLERLKNNPALGESNFFRHQFEEALKDQIEVKNIGNPSLRKCLNYRDLIKKFGRNLPRPPFAPLNVFKLQTLSQYFGKSRLQYGHGQVCTLKVDINKHLLKDEGTHGRATPEVKENWVLAGRKCLKGQTYTNSVVGDSVLSFGPMGYSKLPSIGSNSTVGQFTSWAPRKGFVRRVSSEETGHSGQKGNRRLKQTSVKKQKSVSGGSHEDSKKKPKLKKHSQRKSSSRHSLNNWGSNGDSYIDVISQSQKQTHANTCHEIDHGQISGEEQDG